MMSLLCDGALFKKLVWRPVHHETEDFLRNTLYNGKTHIIKLRAAPLGCKVYLHALPTLSCYRWRRGIFIHTVSPRGMRAEARSRLL